jgi:hypothetical protein
MSGPSGRPVAAAAALFRRLGYTVESEAPKFVARRKWRAVEVTVLGTEESAAATHALADGGPSSEGPDLRCYVAPRAAAGRVHDRLAGLDPACDWAVVGLDGPDDYEVVSAP